MNTRYQQDGERWRRHFYEVLSRHEYAEPLRQSINTPQPKTTWTTYLTKAVVEASRLCAWQCAAKGYELPLLPIPNEEYLALDGMAFEVLPTPTAIAPAWHFPCAVFELENGDDRRVAYSLWKVLSVRSVLRVVIGYRQTPEEAKNLTHFLSDAVVKVNPPALRQQIDGETLVVIGARSEREHFPDGFFKWWRLNPNTGIFERV